MQTGKGHNSTSHVGMWDSTLVLECIEAMNAFNALCDRYQTTDYQLARRAEGPHMEIAVA